MTMTRMALAALCSVLCAALAAPAAAQEARVSAKDPQSIVDALDAAGFSPKLGADDTGDPRIEVEISGYNAFIYFYGCDETSHTNCDSLQFSAGFNRAKPWSPKEALALARKYRFSSVWLDDEGDPYVNWDVINGDGIPTKVFLSGVNNFGNAIDNVSEAAFAEERAEKD